MKSAFCCPVCARDLERGEKTLTCPAGHAFDRSKKGYVNLLLNNSQSSHGDNEDAIRARRAFLDAGHYAFLADRIAEILFQRVPEGGFLLDEGCGEGYYTRKFAEALAPKGCRVAGTDISKTALRTAGGRGSAIEYAVAANARLPLKDSAADAVTALFTPVSEDETARVIKPDGVFLHVQPGAKHLMGLKRALYASPYENEISTFGATRFQLLSRETLTKTALLDRTDAQNLFRMTPYYYKTSKEAQEAFARLESLETEFSFVISIYSPVGARR